MKFRELPADPADPGKRLRELEQALTCNTGSAIGVGPYMQANMIARLLLRLDFCNNIHWILAGVSDVFP